MIKPWPENTRVREMHIPPHRLVWLVRASSKSIFLGHIMRIFCVVASVSTIPKCTCYENTTCTALQACREIKPPPPDARLRRNWGRGDCGNCSLPRYVVKAESRMTQDFLPTACSVHMSHEHRADFKEYRGLSEWAAGHHRLNYDDEQLKGAPQCFGKASVCTPSSKGTK